MNCDSLIADSVSIGLVLVDGAGRVCLWNAWIELRAARPSAQVLGLTLGEAFGARIDPRIVLVVREALDFGWSSRLSHALHPMPLPLFQPGSEHGERMLQAVDVTPVNIDGERCCLLQVRDVTETVRREALLRQQARQLREDIQRLSRAQAELQRSRADLRAGAEQARDAAEAVMVEYDELPNVVNVDDATAAGAVALCDEAPDNIAAEMRHGNADATTAAFAQALLARL